jgi:hypothetical protein
MHFTRYSFPISLFGVYLLAASGCSDPRETIIEQVDRDFENRIRETRPVGSLSGETVTTILEVIELPIASMERILAQYHSATEGNAIRREVEIAMRMNEANLEDILVARGEIGKASKIESVMLQPQPTKIEKGQDIPSVGSNLEFESTRVSETELSLRMNHHFSHFLSLEPLQGWIPASLSSESEFRVRSGDYILLSAAKAAYPDGEKKDSVFLLFLRADFR